MATNEASFKQEFRKALEKHYGEMAKIWTNNDMFRCGLPDFSIHWKSTFFPVEAKFTVVVPKSIEKYLLKHEVSATQLLFMDGIIQTGGMPVILIGMPDTAVAVPYIMWPVCSETGKKSKNISMEKVSLIAGKGLRFDKTNHGWQVGNFLERIAKEYGKQ